MTLTEAKNLRVFKEQCTCGGYVIPNAHMIKHPHSDWCPQKIEWEDWRDTLKENNEDIPDVINKLFGFKI